MKKIINLLFGKELNEKFATSKEMIKKDNQRALKYLYILFSAVMVLLIIIDLAFELYVLHWDLLLIFAIYYIIGLIISLCKVRKSALFVRIECLLFVAISLVLTIIIEDIRLVNLPIVIFPLLMVFFALAFIEKPLIMISLQAIFVVSAIILSYTLNIKTIFFRDLICGGIAYISMIYASIKVSMTRVNEFLIKGQLRKDSCVDELSGLYNRRSLSEYKTSNSKIFVSKNKNISAIMVDIDFFKNYNDTYGHIKGDDCIRSIASVLRKAEIEHKLFVGRYGGEEFIILLPEHSLTYAKKVAREIVSGVAKLKIPHSTSTYKIVTVSAGCSAKFEDRLYEFSKLVNMADNRLYKAKIKGKNTVV